MIASFQSSKSDHIDLEHLDQICDASFVMLEVNTSLMTVNLY